jgi:wyosine [tRNA(Phe)-imidazoG37] synthetase (radical SAM superfamily)
MSSPSIQSSWAVVQDHSRVFRDLIFVYPVISRRSQGLSIGINLNPDKRCNFDCVYCEVDRRTPGRADRVDVAQLKDELRWLIRFAQEGGLAQQPKFCEVPELTRVVRDIAFSGDGEPTLIPNFSECVQAAIDVRHEFGLDQSKLVLITDSAGLDKPDVRKGLALMAAHRFEFWCKLDAGTEEYYRTINRSLVRLDRILANITRTAKEWPIIIQSLFLKWQGEPMSPSELEAYCGRLRDIVAAGGVIREVHAYTIARPTPEAAATRLSPGELEAVAATIRSRTGLSVSVYA